MHVYIRIRSRTIAYDRVRIRIRIHTHIYNIPMFVCFYVYIIHYKLICICYHRMDPDRKRISGRDSHGMWALPEHNAVRSSDGQQGNLSPKWLLKYMIWNNGMYTVIRNMCTLTCSLSYVLIRYSCMHTLFCLQIHLPMYSLCWDLCRYTCRCLYMHMQMHMIGTYVASRNGYIRMPHEAITFLETNK